MISRTLLTFITFLTITNTAHAGFWDDVKGLWNRKEKPIPAIDVLIANDTPSVMLEVKGNYKLVDPNLRQQISKRFLGKKKVLESQASGLRWGEEFPGVFQLQIIPEDRSVTTVVDGVEYKGAMTIYDIGGAISIVNRVPIEDYLASVLPTHYRDPLKEETLASVAIAERTNAHYMAQHPKNRYWAVDGIAIGYQGLDSAEPGSDMDRAIKTTRHMVMSKTGTYEGKLTPFPAHWTTITGVQGAHAGVNSKISLKEADDLGYNGKHAAQILQRAFPGAHIEVIN